MSKTFSQFKISLDVKKDNNQQNLITCLVNEQKQSTNCWKCHCTLGGVLRFELDRGVPLEPQNPYPSLRVILTEKGTHF